MQGLPEATRQVTLAMEGIGGRNRPAGLNLSLVSTCVADITGRTFLQPLSTLRCVLWNRL